MLHSLLFIKSALLASAFQLGAIISASDCPIPETSYLPSTTIVKVESSKDIYKRLLIPTSKHVTLEIQNNINGVDWFLNSSFSNTTLVSKCGVGFILSAHQNFTPITIFSVTRFSIHNVKIQSFYASNSTILCNDIKNRAYSNFNTIKYDIGSKIICPSIVIAWSKSVQVVQSTFVGRVILYGTSDTYFDGNFVTTYGIDFGILTGNIGNWRNLSFPLTIIRNNFINDTNVGILVGGTAGPSIGVHILNNNISRFTWAAVQFTLPGGHGAVHNYMAYNFVYIPNNYPMSSEGTNVFMNTYWVGFNNSIRFNYFLQEEPRKQHGFYMAMGTSGSNIKMNILDGANVPLKLHTGKYNQIENNLIYGSMAMWPIECMFSANQDNCHNTQYYTRWAFGDNQFDTSTWKSLIPWGNGTLNLARDICNIITIDGINCNTNNSGNALYYNCSGIPFGNSVKLATVKSRQVLKFKLPLNSALPVGLSCPSAPNVDIMNTWSQSEYPLWSVYRGSNGLLYINKSSSLAKEFPSLLKFPYSNIGVKSTKPDFFLGLRNV